MKAAIEDSNNLKDNINVRHEQVVEELNKSKRLINKLLKERKEFEDKLDSKEECLATLGNEKKSFKLETENLLIQIKQISKNLKTKERELTKSQEKIENMNQLF